MNTRDAVGRTITKIVQTRTVSNSGSIFYDLERIELDDGTRLVPIVVETKDEYGIEILTLKPTKEPKP